MSDAKYSVRMAKVAREVLLICRLTKEAAILAAALEVVLEVVKAARECELVDKQWRAGSAGMVNISNAQHALDAALAKWED